ncbi:hypothetical protein [uncultured Streptococcus sp.]|uniref:hypothetical protein n=1 Tax=uncultured Streptococcus sp. TaxID=83427 RepID=UPI002595ED12|nr:hypothetical protein [uncultured Streptococcus sp.]
MIKSDKLTYSMFMTSEDVKDWGEASFAINANDEVKSKGELLAMPEEEREAFLRDADYIEFGNPKAFQTKEELEEFEQKRLKEVGW